jgi:shikimate dehydrogenase
MPDSFLPFLDNAHDLELPTRGKFAAIIGEMPSRGAKSPILWNACFSQHRLDGVMLAFDVAEKHLGNLIAALKREPRFIGGAVAVPYKQAIIPFLDGVDEIAGRSGSVNNLFWQKDQLFGTNTDGIGALKSFQNRFGKNALKGKTILLIGLGGAGKAVGACFSQEIGREGKLIISVRTPEKCRDYLNRIAELTTVQVVEFPVPQSLMTEVHGVINCSSIGFEGFRSDVCGEYCLRPFSPLAPLPEFRWAPGTKDSSNPLLGLRDEVKKNCLESLEALCSTRPQTWFFDIVYQPSQTLLLSLAGALGFPCLNGAGMNLEQAIVGFLNTTRSFFPIEEREIRAVMTEMNQQSSIK